MKTWRRSTKKDLAEQRETFNDSKPKETRKETRKLSTTPKRNIKDKKCWFHENGFCKKESCDFLHPLQICSNYNKFGQCPQGLGCALRHPLRVCMTYMEGGCVTGDKCVLQHPASQSPPRSFSVSPSREGLAKNLPYPAYPQPIFPFPFPSTATPQSGTPPQPSVAQPSNLATFQTQPLPPFSQVVSGMFGPTGSPSYPTSYQTPPPNHGHCYPPVGSPSGPGIVNNQQQQGFW